MRGCAPSAYIVWLWIALHDEPTEVVQATHEFERHTGGGYWDKQVRERQRPQPDQVHLLPLKIQHRSVAKLHQTSSCTAMYQNCNKTRLCCNETAACVEKDKAFAGCRTSCKPGVHKTDEAKYRTPWSCIQLDFGIREWEVLYQAGADVRARPDDLAKKIAWKPRGSIIQGLQQGSWLSLEATPGFVRIWDNDEERLKQGRLVAYRPTTTSTTSTTVTEFILDPSSEISNNRTAHLCSAGHNDSGAGHNDSEHGPPITLEAFKRRMFEWYPTAEVAFVALGSRDPARWINRIWQHAFPLQPDEFKRRTHELQPPLSCEQALYVFRILDNNSDNFLESSELVYGLGIQKTPPNSESNDGATVQNARIQNTTSTTESPSHAFGHLLVFKIPPVPGIISGILAFLLLPCVIYVGCRIYGKAKHGGRGWRDTYAQLGGRTAVAVLPHGQVLRNRRVWQQQRPSAPTHPTPPKDQLLESQSLAVAGTNEQPVRSTAESPGESHFLPHMSRKMSL